MKVRLNFFEFFEQKQMRKVSVPINFHFVNEF